VSRNHSPATASSSNLSIQDEDEMLVDADGEEADNDLKDSKDESMDAGE
jgi:hypothetical protein